MGHWWISVAGDASSIVVDGEEEEFGEPEPVPGARLLRVDTRTGMAEELMTLTRQYDGLAATPAGMFYATSDQSVYLIDPVGETETLTGELASSQMMGLECAGDTLCGFSVVNGRLVPMLADGSAIGSSIDVGATNLRSIVFMRDPDAPSPQAASFD